jgi:hypothetical protein
MQRSGARLAWDHFHPDAPKIPTIILYVEDRDLWIKKLPFSDAVTLALRSYPQEFGVWDVLDMHALATEGTAMLRYYNTLVSDMKTQAEMMEVAGHIVPVVNAPYFMASDLGNELAGPSPFAVVYSVNSRGYRYSLRSSKFGIDVSEIAKSYGGGGHFHAAGFESKTPVHTTI